MTKIYSLTFAGNYGHDDYDGKFLGSIEKIPTSVTELCRLNRIPGLEKPSTLDFRSGNLTRLKISNIANVNVSLDVLSKDLLDVISNVGRVHWTLVPVRFLCENGKDCSNGRFSGVFLNEHLDCFDYEKSVYKMKDWSQMPQDKVNDRMRKKVRSVRELYLREPDPGFPPYFRLLAMPTRLYISQSTHEAILEANLVGLNMTLIGDF